MQGQAHLAPGKVPLASGQTWQVGRLYSLRSFRSPPHGGTDSAHVSPTATEQKREEEAAGDVNHILGTGKQMDRQQLALIISVHSPQPAQSKTGWYWSSLRAQRAKDPVLSLPQLRSLQCSLVQELPHATCAAKLNK